MCRAPSLSQHFIRHLQMNETPNPQCLQCLVRCAHHRIPSPAQHFTSSPSRAVSTPTSYVRRALEKPCAGPHNPSPGLVFPHQFPFDTRQAIIESEMAATGNPPRSWDPRTQCPPPREVRAPRGPASRRAGTDQGGPVRAWGESRNASNRGAQSKAAQSSKSAGNGNRPSPHSSRCG